MAKKDPLPTRTEIRRARKAELQKWCRRVDLEEEGTVVELRERLLAFRDEWESEEEEAAEAEEAEEEEIVEAVYEPKAKAVLSPEVAQGLRVRRALQSRRPQFRRQEWFRYRRLGSEWRRPRGHHSKLRRRLGYRPAVPSAGYRGPRQVRGLHPSGFQEVLVHRPEDLEGLDPATQAARIAHGVGTRKRLQIQELADEAGIRILNRVIE